MSTILQFKMPEDDGRRRAVGSNDTACEIVIFPGVRIERQNLDLGHRLRDCAGRGEFAGITPTGRPRKTS